MLVSRTKIVYSYFDFAYKVNYNKQFLEDLPNFTVQKASTTDKFSEISEEDILARRVRKKGRKLFK